MPTMQSFQEDEVHRFQKLSRWSWALEIFIDLIVLCDFYRISLPFLLNTCQYMKGNLKHIYMTVLGNSVLYDSGYLPFCSLAPPERSESSAPHGALSNMHRTAEPVSLPPLSSIVWFISTPSVTPVSGWELYKGRPDPDSISYACHCISSLFTGYLSVTFF